MPLWYQVLPVQRSAFPRHLHWLYAYGIAAVPFFLVGSGCLCPLFRAGMIDGVGFAVRLAAMGANGFFGAGGSAAGVLRVAFLSRVIRHIAAFIGTFMPVMRCIGRPIGLPAVARGWNRLYFCCAALGAAICLFARFCAGRRCCYRTAVPSHFSRNQLKSTIYYETICLWKINRLGSI